MTLNLTEIQNRLCPIYKDGRGLQQPHIVVGDGLTDTDGNLEVNLAIYNNRELTFTDKDSYFVFVTLVDVAKVPASSLQSVERFGGSKFVIHTEFNTQRISWLAIGN